MTQVKARTVAYFVNWAIYARKHFPQDLPVENLTHILYAFANVRNDGEVFLTDTWSDTDIHFDGDSWNDSGTNLYGCLKQINLHKKRNRNLNLLLSIGGWTYSANFKGPASTPQGREKFAKSSLELVKHLGLDGIDIDWEYPQNAEEAQHYVELLAACRQELDAHAKTLKCRPHFELTVACPAGAQNYTKLKIREMDKYLDFWNLMAYDYAGSWDKTAGHQANLHASSSNPSSTPFSTDGAVKHYIEKGVAPHKMVLGMPLYGRAFEQTDGPGKPYSGIGQGNWEQGVYDYKNLPLEGAQEHTDEHIGAGSCYHSGKRTFVTYDTPALAKIKTNYIKEKGLGGAMWWESSGDAKGGRSLISSVVQHLGGKQALLQKQNCLEYPSSKYTNVRNGFA